MDVPVEIDRLEIRRVAPPAPHDATSRKATQFWDVVDPTTQKAIAHAEIFEKADQWGVRVFDRAPQLDETDLTRIVARLLVWHAGCTVETVDLWLARNGARSVMVRVSGDYV
jgi:uncharacterized membrane protein (DUF2068 family)